MLTVGTYLADRYEIVSKIGAGGMSDVYKAKDHVLGRFVAIKVLKPEFSEDRGFVAKFRTEAQSAAGLEHPNIVNIYYVVSEEGLHCIVMEYVEGSTLKKYIEKKGQLSFKEAVSIAIQVARGIEAAHNKSDRSARLNAFEAYSRVECRSDNAFITAPVRFKLGFGNLITLSAAKAAAESIKQTNNSCTFLITVVFKN